MYKDQEVQGEDDINHFIAVVYLRTFFLQGSLSAINSRPPLPYFASSGMCSVLVMKWEREWGDLECAHETQTLDMPHV